MPVLRVEVAPGADVEVVAEGGPVVPRRDVLVDVVAQPGERLALPQGARGLRLRAGAVRELRPLDPHLLAEEDGAVLPGVDGQGVLLAVHLDVETLEDLHGPQAFGEARLALGNDRVAGGGGAAQASREDGSLVALEGDFVHGEHSHSA